MVYVAPHASNAPGLPESLLKKTSWSLSPDPYPLYEHIVERVSNHLKPLLQDSREWLEQDAIEVDGGLLVRGDVAEVWVGTMGDRKVAIKSYRPSFPCPDYLPFYEVSGAYLRYVP